MKISYNRPRKEVIAMTKDEASVDKSVLELLEISELDSPYTHQLLKNYRRRIVNRLLKANKIDQTTADYLYT